MGSEINITPSHYKGGKYPYVFSITVSGKTAFVASFDDSLKDSLLVSWFSKEIPSRTLTYLLKTLCNQCCAEDWKDNWVRSWVEGNVWLSTPDSKVEYYESIGTLPSGSNLIQTKVGNLFFEYTRRGEEFKATLKFPDCYFSNPAIVWEIIKYTHINQTVVRENETELKDAVDYIVTRIKRTESNLLKIEDSSFEFRNLIEKILN